MDYIQKPQRKRNWGRIIINILFVCSILANIFLFMVIIAMGVMIASSGGVGLMEKTIISGPAHSKIAIINLDGVIDYEAENNVKRQINSAARDSAVKALILKVSSPGGGVSSSDNIHHMISRYKENYNKPVICYMDGLAASGGYYSAVACDKIIASPTTITGSIGVIMGHLDLSRLFQEKLGITPTTIKSGEKKDWPNMFRELSEKEKVYLQTKIIEPAYQRFTELVNQGRENLSIDEVIALADGSIYYAKEAQQFGLIDDTGYFETAVDAALESAELENARVIEYEKPFSFSDVLTPGSQSAFKMNKSTVYKMITPEVMYLWDGRN